jgi:hypothetical protein
MLMVKHTLWKIITIIKNTTETLMEANKEAELEINVEVIEYMFVFIAKMWDKNTHLYEV